MIDTFGFAFVVFGLTSVTTLLWLWGLQRARRDARRLGAPWRALGAVSAALYLVVVLEVVFALFVKESDGYGLTRAGNKWFQAHWRPINSHGYRDVEPAVDGRRVLLIVGDSIAAGHGVARIEDRISSRLARRLALARTGGAEWSVPTVAIAGWNTGDQVEALKRWPHAAERVVVLYTLTDIESAANDVGLHRRDPSIEPPPALVRACVDHSFLFNWLYWRHWRTDFGRRYPDFILSCYEDPTAWAAHEVRLRALIAAARALAPDVRFVLWPDLPRLDESAAAFAKVNTFLAGENVPTLDLTPRFHGRELRTLIVNTLDEHPNEAVHDEVAGWIAEWLAGP